MFEVTCVRERDRDTGCETTLAPPSTASTTNISGNLHIYSIKIPSMSDSCVKFHEPELIFNPWNRLSYWTYLKSKNTTKMLIFLTERTKIWMFLAKILRENHFFHLNLVTSVISIKRYILTFLIIFLNGQKFGFS